MPSSDYPFPPKPITADVVREQIALGGWKSALCALCGDVDAASWHVEGKDASRYICPNCQRFTITGPASRGMEVAAKNDPEHARAHRTELMRASAASEGIFTV